MEPVPLTPEYKEFLQFLNSENVEYMVVGAYADIAVGGFHVPMNSIRFRISCDVNSEIRRNKRRIISPTEYCCCWETTIPA